MLNPEDGKTLLEIARRSVESVLEKGSYALSAKYSEKFSEKHGVFVTITLNNKLRGCIGFPLPLYPVGEAIVKAAKAAAFEDPRFSSLSPAEVPLVRFEISVLTIPHEIKIRSPEDYLNKIKIGEDGLILEKAMAGGLLLPQVADEYGWSVEVFLENLCMKASLPPNAWRDKDCKIYKFQAKIFKE